MSWEEINAKYVRQGELLLEPELLKDWRREVTDMNGGKEGRPFRYPESFITFVGIAQTVFHLPNRQAEGFFRALSKYVGIEAPDHTTIGRRISKLDLRIDEHLIRSNELVVIALDSSGVEVTNREDWIRNPYCVDRRGWLKLHVAVDTRSKQILSMEVTEEDAYDTGMLIRSLPMQESVG